MEVASDHAIGGAVDDVSALPETVVTEETGVEGGVLVEAVVALVGRDHNLCLQQTLGGRHLELLYDKN